MNCFDRPGLATLVGRGQINECVFFSLGDYRQGDTDAEEMHIRTEIIVDQRLGTKERHKDATQICARHSLTGL